MTLAIVEFKVFVVVRTDDVERIDACEIGEEIRAAIKSQCEMSGLASDDDPSEVQSFSVTHVDTHVQ